MTETWENRGMPGNVEVKDASGKVIAKTSLLAGSQRPEATLELDGEKFPQPWTISVHGAILIGWDGEATAVTLAPLPKSSTNEPAEAAGEEPPDSAD
jgi:hypothetical protein